MWLIVVEVVDTSHRTIAAVASMSEREVSLIDILLLLS